MGIGDGEGSQELILKEENQNKGMEVSISFILSEIGV